MARRNRPPPLKPRVNPAGPRYVSPRERAENRARWKRFFYGCAMALPILFMAVAIGYSDQMPEGVRAAAESIDATFGYPVLRLIALVLG